MVNHTAIWLCLWLWAMPQAWRHVKPIHFRSENTINIIFTKHPHFYHSAFIDRYVKANYSNQNQIFKSQWKKSSSALEDQRYFVLCWQQMKQSFRKTNSVWIQWSTRLNAQWIWVFHWHLGGQLLGLRAHGKLKSLPLNFSRMLMQRMALQKLDNHLADTYRLMEKRKR